MTTDEARSHIGHGVVYRPRPGARPELGTITSVSATMAFVLYAGDVQAKATDPADLELLSPAQEFRRTLRTGGADERMPG